MQLLKRLFKRQTVAILDANDARDILNSTGFKTLNNEFEDRVFFRIMKGIRQQASLGYSHYKVPSWCNAGYSESLLEKYPPILKKIKELGYIIKDSPEQLYIGYQPTLNEIELASKNRIISWL